MKQVLKTVLGMLGILFLVMGIYGWEVKAQEIVPIEMIPISSEDELQSYVDHNGSYTFREELKGEVENTKLYSLTLKEAGQVTILSFKNGWGWNAEINIYANNELTRKLGQGEVTEGGRFLKCYLDEGTYYYSIRLVGNSEGIITSYAGFIPSSKMLQPSVKLHADKSSAIITATSAINPCTFRVVGGIIPYQNMSYNAGGGIWSTSAQTFVPGGSIRVTSNGTYTIRTEKTGKPDENVYAAQVTVSGLKTGNPKVSKVTNVKKNVKKIRGTATAYTKVYVRIGNNKKVYSATVGKNGKFTVKTPKMKAGAKVRVWCTNSAAKSSKVKTITVKR